jgi:chromosome segregation ATPase
MAGSRRITIAAVAREVDELRGQLSLLEGLIRAAAGDPNALSSRWAELRQQLDDVAEGARVVEDRVTDASTRLERLSNLDTQIAGARNDLRGLDLELKKLRAGLDGAQRQVEVVGEKSVDTSGKLAGIDAKTTVLDRLASELQTKLDDMYEGSEVLTERIKLNVSESIIATYRKVGAVVVAIGGLLGFNLYTSIESFNDSRATLATALLDLKSQGALIDEELHELKDLRESTSERIDEIAHAAQRRVDAIKGEPEKHVARAADLAIRAIASQRDSASDTFAALAKSAHALASLPNYIGEASTQMQQMRVELGELRAWTESESSALEQLKLELDHVRATPDRVEVLVVRSGQSYDLPKFGITLHAQGFEASQARFRVASATGSGPASSDDVVVKPGSSHLVHLSEGYCLSLSQYFGLPRKAVVAVIVGPCTTP